MAETSALNSGKVEQSDAVGEVGRTQHIKKEEPEVRVKCEVMECAVCAARSPDTCDLVSSTTLHSGAPLMLFLCKYTNTTFTYDPNVPKSICKSCLDLINVLEQAEIEYMKLKDTFDAILSKSPLFSEVAVKVDVKLERNDDAAHTREDSSDDEPLSKTKSKRHIKAVKKKKLSVGSKRKQRTKTIDDSWECDECGVKGEVGGEDALGTHKLTAHTLTDTTLFKEDVKTEDSADGYTNGFDSCLQMDFDDFDESSNFSDTFNKSTCKSTRVNNNKHSNGTPKQKKKQSGAVKIMHPCDQCNSKFSSIVRLEKHKVKKHDGSKPPYICEVCGAHYKHRRACDIHIALHKGISDWKCEECNKLFPSKNALQRHNNIHTGKLNYQCDLCGKSFIHTSSFKMHKLSHTGVKPHACDVCGLALMTRSHLKRHKRIHSGEKRHECTVCGKRFSERYNLLAHSKSHEAAGAEASAGEPQRRVFRCSFCPERFERRYLAERHAAAVHGRALERPPPTPRNTMSKMLKAQAQRPQPSPNTETDSKEAPSPQSRPAPTTAQKLIAQLSSTSIIAPSSWSGAYAAEYGLRTEFPH